ncbi:hypothetical protein TIFTF001_017527 [Ficus carica]|uniref:Uncharacterized protein n=1 Tax=Ficus carica TaxID=3494 RepID=A0AA88AAT2_FICCA|nr:hypothetical protein TIFTF001_017527 [Ficus carica]
MSKGRGGAVQMAAIVAVLLCAVASLECVRAATCTVGDAGGWSFNVNSWPKGKRFRAPVMC